MQNLGLGREPVGRSGQLKFNKQERLVRDEVGHRGCCAQRAPTREWYSLCINPLGR